MKKKIYFIVDKNKGSCKDPSCIFKIITVIFLIYLIFNFENGFRNKKIETLNFVKNNNLFLVSALILEEPSETIIFQKNTIYAFSPLYIPERIQVLGAQIEEEQCREEITSYKVGTGENLSFIASKFGISVGTIVSANNLKNNMITPGQELIILPVSGVFHITQSGDTVSSVASKYKAEEEGIIYCNQLDDPKLYAGDILIVPGGKIPKPSVVKKSSPSSLNYSTTISDGSSWLIPPATGYISQRLHWYNAVDIANDCNTTPIYASASGVIQKTGYDNTAGYYVRIEHPNGVVTFYGHFSRILVSIGQNVTQGSVIGYMGNTGYTIGLTGCHVHFEVRGAINPFSRYLLNHTL